MTDILRLAVAAVLEADKEFCANMPPEWEGDPLSDEIDGLRRVFMETTEQWHARRAREEREEGREQNALSYEAFGRAEAQSLSAALSRPIDPKAEVAGYTSQYNLDEVKEGRLGYICPTGTLRPEQEIPLYASPPIVAPVGVPEGWQLVPKEPTSKMHKAAWDACDNGMKPGNDWKPFNTKLWAAMLASAPALTPAEKAGVVDGDAALIERCAKIAEDNAYQPPYSQRMLDVAAAIRALSTTKPAQGDGE